RERRPDHRDRPHEPDARCPFREPSVKSEALFAIVALSVAACAPSQRPFSTAAPSPDPRVGLRAGWMDAGEAAWNIQLVSTTPPSPDFINRSNPGDFQFINSDLSFTGPYVIQGNFSGVQVWDITNLKSPRLHKAFVCPGSQSDVSVYRQLLFVSGAVSHRARGMLRRASRFESELRAVPDRGDPSAVGASRAGEDRDLAPDL